MTKRQTKQQPMQSSLPETDKVALTDSEKVEDVSGEMTTELAIELSEEMVEDLQKEKEDIMRKEIKAEMEKVSGDPTDEQEAAFQKEKKAKERAEMMAEIKAELIKELASEHEQKLAMVEAERSKNEKERATYVAKMKNSSEPWVDWVSAISDENGVGMELDWNDAYVDFLRANGVTGADDDVIVHKYVTLLLRQGADAIDEEFEDKSKYEG